MNLFDEVKNTIAGVLGLNVDDLKNDADMSEVENWDSMHHVMIISALEDKFDLTFSEDKLFDLTSVNSFYEEVKAIKEN